MKKFFITMILFGAMFFNGCFNDVKEPVLPNWDVDLNIPVTNKSYQLAEIIDTSNNIRIQSDPTYGDSVYFFVIDDVENSTPILDSIIVPLNPFPITFPVALPNLFDSVKAGFVYNPSTQVHVDTATFKSGEFFIVVNNSDDFPLELEFILPGFKHKSNGNILAQRKSIPANTQETLNLNLANYIYAELPVRQGENDINNYQYQGAQGFLIVIKAGSTSPFVDFQFGISSTILVMERLVGTMRRTDLGTSTITVKTEFGDAIKDFAENINLRKVNFQLNVETFGEMKNILVYDSLEITGYKKDRNGNLIDPFKLRVNGNDYVIAELKAGELMTLELNEENSNIIPFLLNLPQSLEIKSRVVLDKNPDVAGNMQVISSNDSIRYYIDISAPLVVSAQNATLEDTILISDEISQDDRDDIAQANSATLTLEIENGIPLGISGKAIFTDENYNPLFSIRNISNNLESDVLKVDPAVTDNNGIPTTAVKNQLTLVLNKEEIEQFKIAKYILTEVKIVSAGYDRTPPLFVPVRANDAVKFKIFGGVNYHLDPERE